LTYKPAPFPDLVHLKQIWKENQNKCHWSDCVAVFATGQSYRNFVCTPWSMYLVKSRMSVNTVSIATRYGLDGPGIESRWGRDFPHPPSLLYNGYRVFPEGKAAGEWRWQPTPSSAEVKKRVELYLYSPSGPSWSVIGELYLYLTVITRTIALPLKITHCAQTG
jgi:hypothetical protein